jgi:membrane-bound lytic murein transglycosylase D
VSTLSLLFRRSFVALALGALPCPAALAQEEPTGVSDELEAGFDDELAFLRDRFGAVEPLEDIGGADLDSDRSAGSADSPADDFGLMTAASPDGILRADLFASLEVSAEVPANPYSFDPAAIERLPLGIDSVNHPELLEFIEYYVTEGRTRATRWLARAGLYRDMVEETAARVGAPPELLWVAAIESSFTPDARSHAGAVGMWQFMERSGRGAGMRIDRYVDERLDFEIATEFALNYLLSRYATFRNWPVSLAAYNAGSGHAMGEIRESNLTDFWQMAPRSCLYSDARRYALRIVTMAIIDLNRDALGFDGVVADEPVRFDSVEIRGGVRLSLVADAADVSTSEIRALNPALRQGQTPPGDPWIVRIPYGTRDAFVAAYDDIADRYGEEHEEIVLRFGQTIGELADHVGVPERVLRSINGFEPDDRVPYGSVVLVPNQGRSGNEDDEDPGEPRTVIVPAISFSYPGRHRVFYEVHNQDRLIEIAEHFGIEIYDLAAWNDLDPNASIWSGMVLQIWVDDAFDLSSSNVLDESLVTALRAGSAEYEAWANPPESSSASRSSSRSSRRTHTVEAGDTVGGIARSNGVRAEDVLRWNGLDADDLIMIGQRLYVGP